MNNSRSNTKNNNYSLNYFTGTISYREGYATIASRKNKDGNIELLQKKVTIQKWLGRSVN